MLLDLTSLTNQRNRENKNVNWINFFAHEQTTNLYEDGENFDTGPFVTRFTALE